MFAPIVLRSGVTVADFPAPEKREKSPRAPLTDSEALRHELGIHAECGNPMYFYRVANTHAVAVCVACQIRVLVSNTVTTYSDLRSAFSKPNEAS